MSIIASNKTDLFVGGIGQFDELVWPSIEATVLHAWYADLWDVATDDPNAWNATTICRLLSLVERDRQGVKNEELGDGFRLSDSQVNILLAQSENV